MTDLQGGVSITTQNLVPTGVATAASTVALDKINNAAALLIQVSGTYTGALSVQGRIDRTNWVTLGTIPSAGTGLFRAGIAGLEEVRVTALAAVTGTAVVTLRTSIGRGLEALATPITDTGVGMVVSGSGFRNRFSFARVADTNAYAAGDVIGINAAGSPGSAIHTFTGVGPAGGHIFITDAHLEIDKTAIISGETSYRLHLYDASPTAILDNAAWDLVAGDRASYLGYIDLGIPVDLGSTVYVQNLGVNKKVKLAAGVSSLFGVLQTIGAYTPASGTVYVMDLHTVAV